MKIEIDVPNGVSNNWEVDEFTISEKQYEEQRLSYLKSGRIVPQGTYKRLKRDGVIVMTNTPDEIRDFLHDFRGVEGKVLINGLGLGVTVKYLLDNPKITEVIVIEKSQDVINLVAETYKKDPRFKVINSCCFDYTPPKNERYNFVWHDIWDYISSGNLEEMKKLHRKYGRKTDLQASWCRYECEQMKKNDRSYF